VSNRTLIKGGIVLTQDDELGELPNADILVEDDRISAIGPNLSAEGAEVIDAEGDIVIPGFIDTHRHTWETSIRTSAPDYTLGAYFGGILDKFAPQYRPDDVYAGNLWGALECANAGITTLVDWSHIMNTPEHADEAIRGLSETGIRGVFAYGFYPVPLADPHFGEHEQRVADARRVRDEQFSGKDGPLAMGETYRSHRSNFVSGWTFPCRSRACWYPTAPRRPAGSRGKNWCWGSTEPSRRTAPKRSAPRPS